MRLLLKNACVVDGTGNPWYRASVAVVGGKIAEVGDIAGGTADETIDVRGMVLCPGFVDMHGHSDYLILANPTAESKVLQGVTTEVAGECGYSSAPLRDKWFQEWWVEDALQRFSVVSREKAEEVLSRHGVSLQWNDLAQYLATVEKARPSLNYFTFVGHVALRVATTGDYMRRPDRQELDEMKRLLREGISQGAFGFSTESGTHRKMDLPIAELEELFSLSAQLGARVAYHLKDYGDKALEALEEGLQIVAQTGVRTILSHLNARGRENWGKAPFILRAIEEARRDGTEVWADVMPYPGGEQLFFSPRAVDMLPQWVADSTPLDIQRTLSDDEKRLRIKAEVAEGKASAFYYVPRQDRTEAYGRGPLADPHWPHYVRIVESRVQGVAGHTVHDISRERGADPMDALLDIIEQDPDTRKVVCTESEQDKEAFITHPLVGFGSDGGLVNAIRRPGIANPTLYSIFPYVLRRFVVEKGVLPLEEAVRKMSSLPFVAHGIRDRGLVRPGYWADLVVFDPRTIEPSVSYDVRMSMPPARGISLVIVNGEITAREGVHTGARAGRVLRDQAK